jgi:nucleotide-binding universal stress UspA family protein
MTEMKYGIVAGYDGSPGGDDALRWAAREAWARGTTLTVVLAWDLARLGEDDPELADLAMQRAERALARGLKYAESAVGDERVHPEVVLEPPARALCARSEDAEMVVVGSRGRGGLAESLLGSVPWHVAGHGHGRIVVVRGQWRSVNKPPGPVVVGVDGSPPARAAIPFAFEEAALRDVHLVAVCALADAPGTLGGLHLLEEEFSREMTEQEKNHQDVTVVREVVAGPPRSALLTAAHEAQLLVIGNRGRGGVAGMSLGSVAQAMLHHAPCPVGVVH